MSEQNTSTKVLVETLRNQGTPEASALASMVEGMDRLEMDSLDHKLRLGRIEAQATKTNGRVTKMESETRHRESFQKGALWVGGGVLSLIVLLLSASLSQLDYLLKLDDNYIRVIVTTPPKNILNAPDTERKP